VITVAVFMGTRPEAIKLAPVIAALAQHPRFRPLVIATGQHRELFDQVVRLFGITVDEDLAVMEPNQSLAALTGRLITKIDDVLARHAPAFALVQGDTTTVLTAALGCYYRKIPVGHVEAGLRTGNIPSPFPEEINRRLTAPLAALHFAPTASARANLLREGIDDATIAVTGNTVVDALFLEIGEQQKTAVAEAIDQELRALVAPDWNGVPNVLVTGHRRENFGGGFAEICTALERLATRFADHRFIYPVHLNPNVRGPVFERLGRIGNVRLIQPVGYRPFVALMRHARLVLTDSGGVQEEAPSLGKPVVLMRDTTERPEGVDAGTVKVVGASAEGIVAEVTRLLTDDGAYRAMSEAKNPDGDGHASARILERMERFFER
jgi:UDP-N-acetylglucosamine 2-epimerase (non-hydrolysing)